MSHVGWPMETWLIVAALAAMMVWFSLRTLGSHIQHELDSRRLERQTRELRASYDERLRRRHGSELVEALPVDGDDPATPVLSAALKQAA